MLRPTIFGPGIPKYEPINIDFLDKGKTMKTTKLVKKEYEVVLRSSDGEIIEAAREDLILALKDSGYDICRIMNTSNGEIDELKIKLENLQKENENAQKENESLKYQLQLFSNQFSSKPYVVPNVQPSIPVDPFNPYPNIMYPYITCDVPQSPITYEDHVTSTNTYYKDQLVAEQIQDAMDKQDNYKDEISVKEVEEFVTGLYAKNRSCCCYDTHCTCDLENPYMVKNG
jgi:hypothetical protein